MSDIDFQNGFVCGMATKGLIKSGVRYEPGGVLAQPSYTTNYDPAMPLTVNERLNTGNYYSTPTYSYVIE